ncbi:MAG: hypothetical protein J6V01_06880 [Clostridia bacterium]|nr:hypothetical protein [Clostridia bacterium]
MKAIRFISVLIAALLIVCSAAACAKSGDPETTTGTPVAQTTPEADATTDGSVDSDGYEKDDLPETMDFGKESFDIFTWNNQVSWEWTSDYETTGDMIKDVIVARQIAVEERMNVKINIHGMAGEWEKRNEFINAVVASTTASGDDAYDLVGQYSFAAPIGTLRGAYVDLNGISGLNLEKPWWPSDITKSSLLNGKCFFTTGDITPTLIRNMQCVLTNLTLAESLGMDDFYTLVKNHQWTAEKFLTYGAGTVTGLNPDGTSALTTTLPSNVVYDNLFYGGGFHYVDTVDGEIKMSDDCTSVRLEDWYGLWRDFLKKNEDVAILAIGGTNGFTSGNVLFHFGGISDVQNSLQEITFKFGILPYPMYDENQKDYCTICGAWVTYYSIPTNAPDKDMSGAVLEALGSAGYRQLTPTVYIAAFQYRFLNSIENAEIFDVLHDTLVFELGRQLGDQLDVFSAFRQAAQDTYDSWSSYYSSKRSSLERTISKIAKNPAIK